MKKKTANKKPTAKKEKHCSDLMKKYPKIFKNSSKSMQESCMFWGIETGIGWYDLLDSLCSSLQWDTDKNNYPQVVADQVKSKFGTLRFYFHTERNPKMYDNRAPKSKLLTFMIDKWNDFFHWYCHKLVRRYKICGRYISILPDVWYHKWSIITDDEVSDAHMRGMISFAETLSGTICERCGHPGKLNDNGWITCLCQPCKDKEELLLKLKKL